MIRPSTILLKRFVFLLIFVPSIVRCIQGQAQDPNLDEHIRIEILESRVKHFYGIEKLEALIDLSSYYNQVNNRKSTRYSRQAVLLAEEMFLDDAGHRKSDPSNHLLNSYLQLGKAYYTANKYIDAKEIFDKANSLAQEVNLLIGITESSYYLDKIDSLAQSGQDLKRGFLSQTLKSIELKETVFKTTLDININAKINAAESHLKQYQYEEAIMDYEEAINLLKNKGDQDQINLINDKISEIRRLMNVDEEVIKNYNDAIAEQERIISELTRSPVVSDKDTIVQKMVGPSTVNSQSDLDIENLEQRRDSLNALANEYFEKKDYGRAEEYRLLYQQVEDEIEKRENAETQLTLLRQQKQLAELDLQTTNMKLEAQQKARWNFIIGIGLLVTLAIALLMLYITKQRDHHKLGIAYNALEETKSKLMVAEGNVQKLLRQQVSEDIAKVLVTEGAELSTKQSFVCIMFLDIRGFTPWAEKHTPEEIIAYQNKIFGLMIDIVNEFKGNINQFLGDGFMATFGAPKSSGNDCQHAFDAAMEIIKQFNDSGDPDIQRTKIGIGLHAGNVVTGNVGTELRKQYSITGNTVILASRIEQLNKEFNSQLIISKEVYDKLEQFNGEVVFQKVTIKGRKIPIEVLTVA